MPAKMKAQGFSPKFPWEDLKANTLRTICQELGQRTQWTKAQTILFLQEIEKGGLQEALAIMAIESELSPASAAPIAKRPRTQSLKRNSEALAEDEAQPSVPYNTRHQGLKRPRVGSESTPQSATPRNSKTKLSDSISAATAFDAPVKRGRGRPRKSSLTSALSKVNNTDVSGSAPANSPVKRGRGRPRNSAAVEIAVDSTISVGTKKEVFYGVVMKSRPRETTEDDDADGEIDDGEGNVLVIPNGGETSSLGSSNKENQPEQPAAEAQPTLETSLVEALNFQAASSSSFDHK